MPQFSLADQNGESFSIGDVLGKKTLVIYFYPKDETPGCTIQACAFRDSYEDFIEAGAEVIGISQDSVESHLNFAKNRRLPFTLLADTDGKVHDAFDLKPGFLGLMMPRVTFVVDKEGVIQHSFSSQLMVNKHVNDALKLVKTL